MKKTFGFATTSGQDYEVALCRLLFLRALRFTADFFLATNVALADKFDDVVLFYRLKDDVGLKYRAILLQAKHKKKHIVQNLSLFSPFQLKEYLKSFKRMKNKWEQSVEVENHEIELQEISLVLYTNTECVVGDAALDVTDSREMQHLQEFLNTGGKLIRITEAQRVGLPQGQETSEFLGHLLICTQQMSVETAEHFLQQELSKTLKLTSPETERKLNSVLRRLMKEWWNEEEKVCYLTAQSAEWIKVLQTMVTHLNSDTLIVDRELNLNYTEDALQEFDVDPRLTNISWISVKDKYQAKIVRSRFFRAHRNSVVVGVEYLEKHLKQVKELWGKSVCPTLAVEMSEGSQKEGSLLLQRLKEAVQKDACKVLFVINKEKPPTDGWNVVEAVATWSVLDEATRERLLKVQVELQGKLVALIDVVCSDVSDVMSDEVIYSLSVCEKEIKLGESMPSPQEFYVPRCLQRIISNTINFDTLKNKNILMFSANRFLHPVTEMSTGFQILFPSDLIGLQKIKEPVLVEKKVLEEEIRNLCTRFRVRGLFGYTDSKGFRSNVAEFIPLTWICGEKVVIIEGVPGVGKSSFVTAMCSSVKQHFPEAWVLRIDMGRHGDYIKERDFTSSSDIKEFLLKGLSKDLNKLEQDLLEHSLYVTENVFLFLDAFDEISPDYTAKCCKLLKGIVQNFRFHQMVVTTRPVTTKDVQKTLETTAFTLPVFSEEEQTLFLERLFVAMGKTVHKEEISSLCDGAGPVLKIPLLCRIAAEVLLNHEEQVLLKCVNPWRKVLLYKLFVEQSVMNRLSEKFGLEDAIPGVKKFLESIQKQHLQNLQGLAVRKLMPVFTLYVSSEMPEEKLGLVVNFGETLDFEHQTFAEYFLGCWLAGNWQKCSQNLLRKLLFQYGFQFVAATLSMSLFEDLPLHMAVAQGDEVAVREHLSSWTKDGGGRSALHVAAMTQGKHRGVWELLVASGEDLNRKDDVLNSTAVMYAEMSENWEFIDFTLVKGVSLEGLNFVKDVNAAKEILLYVTKKDLTNLCQCIFGLHKGIFKGAVSNLYLCKAAAKNSTGVLKVLIEMGHDLNLKNSKGRTPLHEASRYGHMDAVRMLIDKGADPNIKRTTLLFDVSDLLKSTSFTQEITVQNLEKRYCETALMMAAINGHLEVVKLLIKNGANLNVKTMYGVTALMMAVEKGHLYLIKLLIEKGASPNIHTIYGSSALMLAVEKGHLNVIKLLIENGADLNFVTQYGDTALMMAARKGHLEVVKLLIDNGADLNFLRYYRETALMIGARLGHLEVVKLLIENGADLNFVTHFGETALIIGAHKGHLKVVKLLLDNGADLNIQMKNGDTALTMAARLGHLEVVKLLIENVSDLNIKLENGQTALVMTADQGHLEVVKLLIENGADINFQTKNADTALMMAAGKGHLEVVKLLIENGADLNFQTEYGQTALMMATGLGHLEVVNLLIDNGADLNVNDENGDTALMVSVLYGHLELVKLLIEGGAEPNMKNDEGETALMVAARLHSVTIVEYLLTNGADPNITNAKRKTVFEICSEEVLTILTKHIPIF